MMILGKSIPKTWAKSSKTGGNNFDSNGNSTEDGGVPEMVVEIASPTQE